MLGTILHRYTNEPGELNWCENDEPMHWPPMTSWPHVGLESNDPSSAVTLCELDPP